MGAPTSPIHICNMACDKIGEAPITSISPGTTDTELLFARHYDAVRQELLREYVFNFSVRTITLTRVGDAPGTRYRDAYLIPKGLMREVCVGPDNDFRILDFKIQDQVDGSAVLLLNNNMDMIDPNTQMPVPSPTLEFTGCFDITDVTKWDSQFRKCMVLALAVATCYQITKSNNTFRRLDAEFDKALPAAVSVNGQEVPPERIERSRFIEARLRLGTPGVASPYTDLRDLP